MHLHKILPDKCNFDPLRFASAIGRGGLFRFSVRPYGNLAILSFKKLNVK